MTAIQQTREPTKKFWHLVEFAWDDGSGTPGRARYTNWNAGDLAFAGDSSRRFFATANIAIEFPENNGTFDDKALSIVLQQDTGGFVDKVSNGSPFPPVTVTIYEITLAAMTPDDNIDPAQAFTVYVGTVSRTVRNYQGRTKTVKLEATTAKSSLKIALGISSNDQCAWTFGETYSGYFGCKMFAISGGLSATALVTAIQGKTITIPGLVVPGAYQGGNGKFYHRGYVELGELRIGIRDWSPAAPETFVLTREPPPDWLGATVTVLPGCDKTIATCRGRWNNEANFGGMGNGMPNYNPLIEAPPQ